MEKITSNQDLKQWRGRIPIENLYTAGIAGSRFFDGLKEGRILGSKCAACRQTYVPARAFCERCFAELTEYVPVADRGKVVTWTTCRVDMDGKTLEKPRTLAAVQLEGSTTALVHYYRTDRPQIGATVRVVFKPKAKRKGSILDIEGFE